MTIVIVLAVGVLVAFFIVAMYNRLVKLRVTAQNAWSDIDVQLKRRADLVPNLVETVKGYAGHERSTLEAVTAARARAVARARRRPRRASCGRGRADRCPSGLHDRDGGFRAPGGENFATCKPTSRDGGPRSATRADIKTPVARLTPPPH
jgi:hypothetical protein